MLKSALLATVCIAIGAVSVQVLHAQMKPPAYLVSIIDVKNEEGYKKAVPEVRTNIDKAGGKFIITAGAAGAMSKITSLTSGKANRIVVTQWENIDAASKWWAGAGENRWANTGRSISISSRV
jgi:uncharacterized protein (DUF1330 family)